MSLNPTMNSGGSMYWNYSNPNKEGYSTTLVGTVINIQEVQKRTYNPNGPGVPEFWPNGDPKMNIRLVLAQEDGNIKLFTFCPASKAAKLGQKKSIHMDLWHLTGDKNMLDLVGKTIGISTQEGVYAAGNPRPWTVSFVEAGPFQVNGEVPADLMSSKVLCDDAAHGGAMQQPQQWQGYPQQSMQQPMQAQPIMQQPMQQPMQQWPQGMNPQVASSMQNLGVQPQQVQAMPMQQAQPMGMYDQNIPF